MVYIDRDAPNQQEFEYLSEEHNQQHVFPMNAIKTENIKRERGGTD